VSRLIRLYPRAWRDRYEVELIDLVAQRPLDVRGAVDLMRGAIDAHLHPELVGRPSRESVAGRDRPIGMASAAILGGGLWIASGLLMHTTRVDASLGYKSVDFAILLLVLGAIATAVAAIHVAWSGPREPGMRTAAGLMLPLAFVIATPWPILLIGFFGYALAVVAFGGRIALGGRPWLGLPLVISGLVLTSVNTEDERALLTIPLGLAWIALGAFAALRGVPVRPIAASAGT
jgi:hypothetical protein